MRNYVFSLAVYLVLLISSSALYQHQAGVMDWNIKTLGEIAHAKITQEKIYFLNTNGLYGSLYINEIGQIVQSQKTGENKHSLWNKNTNIGLLISDYSQATLYSFQKNSYSILPEIQIQKLPIDFIDLDDQAIAVLTEKKIYFVSKAFSRDSLSAEEHETFLRIEKQRSELSSYIVYSISNEQKTLCSYVINKDHLQNKQLNTSQVQNKQCLLLENHFVEENLVSTIDFLFYNDFKQLHVFDQNKSHWIQENKTIHDARVIYQLGSRQENILIQHTMNSFRVFRRTPDKFAELAKVQKKQDQNIIFLKQDDTFISESEKSVHFAVQEFNSISLYRISNIKGQEGGEPKLLKNFTTESENDLLQGWAKQDGLETLLFVQRENLFTEFFSTKQSAPLWQKHESLANIESLLMVDQSEEARHEKYSPYYDSLDKNGKYNPVFIIPAIKQRLQEEIVDIVSFSLKTIKKIIGWVTKISQIRSWSDIKELNREVSLTEDDDYIYGMKKTVIVVTDKKVVLAIDSKLGNIIWWNEQLSNSLDNSWILEGIYHLEIKEGDELLPQILIVYHSPATEGVNIYKVLPHEGIIKKGISYENFGKKLSVIENKKGTDSLILIDENFKTVVYPVEVQSLMEKEKVLFYRVDKEKNRIVGFTHQGDLFQEIWAVNFAKNEQIIQIDSPYKHYSHQAPPKVALYDDLKVLYKHIDYLNLAVVTKRVNVNNQGVINLYIINGNTGRVLFNEFQPFVELSLPINLVYDQNSVIVTYFNPLQSLYELWVVESYSTNIESSIISLLEKYYFQQKPYSYYEYTEEDLKIIFLEKKYGITLGIKYLSVVETKLSLTRRNLIIITDQEQIHSLDRTLISTRRVNKEQLVDKVYQNKLTSFESVELPPYNYLLPIIPLSTITYNLNLQGLNKVYFSPTQLESTTSFIAYGGDIFMTMIAPDKTFDMLSEEFNYIQLVGTVILVFALVAVMRKMSKNSLVFKLFHK